MRRATVLLGSVFVFLLAAGLIAAAQTDRAGIVGTINDPSGAVLSGANVTILNVDTGQSFTTTTGSDGRYSTPSVFKAGKYQVEASHSGFKTAKSDVIVLQIGDVREINLAMQVGAQSETVDVTAEASALQTETSSLGGVVTGRQITELPLKDRNFTNLALLTPGVSRAFVGILGDQTQFNQGDPNAGSVQGMGDSRGSTEAGRFGRSGGAAISANGLRPTNNNFSMDGVDNNEPQFGTIGVFPNPEAIQEFKVDTSVAKAESGRGGATVNVGLKSGTNSLHGSVYYYGQNSALNATHAEINRQRAIQVASGKTEAQAEALFPKTATHINEYGFTVGGPIIKNRMFFFGDFLGQRNSIPNFFKTAVPSQKSRNGDFSEFTSPVIDPLTGLPFPGNVIPNLQNRPDFVPQGFKLFSFYPTPNIPNVKNASDGNPNFAGTRANTEDIDSFDVKLDHRLTTNNNISARYTRDNQKRVRANFFPNLPTAGFGAGDELGNTRQVVISDTHTFSPRVLNEARFGWTSVDIGIFNCGVGGACGVSPTFCNDIGIPNCNKGTLATSGGILTGGFGNGFFEFTGDGGLFLVKSNNFYVADSLTVISGKHTWKTGIEARPRRLSTIDGGRSGGLKGNIGYGDSCGKTGNVQADVLLGSSGPCSATSGSILGGDKPFDLRTTEWSLFVQDDWKIAPRLTVNLGLRYDLFPTYTEANARLANFDVATGQVIRAKDGSDRTVDTAMLNFGPRVGFAYSLGKTNQFVLHGGYGLFYTQDGYDYPPLVRNPPLTNTVSVGGTGVSLKTGPPVAPIVDPPKITPDLTFFVIPRKQKLDTVHEYNFGAAWQIAQTWVLDLSYAGTGGRHLLAERELGNNGNGLGLARTPANSPQPNQLINDVLAYENRATSDYSALQVKLNRRFSAGLTGTLAYTWSHNIDDSTGVFGGAGESRGQAGGPIDPLNFAIDRGNSSLDHRHLFNSSWIYDLPFGKGRKYGAGMGSLADKVIGGWQANVIWSGSTGQHFSVIGDNGSTGQVNANLIGDPYASLQPGRFLNVAAFTDPKPGKAGTTCVNNLGGKQICFGNSGRNRFTGPGYFRTDFSLFKNTSITERITTQFGLEAFNLLNQTNRIVPNTNIDDTGGFGVFQNALPPRTMQYRMKIIF
jgi:hypothetical protein